MKNDATLMDGSFYDLCIPEDARKARAHFLEDMHLCSLYFSTATDMIFRQQRQQIREQQVKSEAVFEYRDLCNLILPALLQKMNTMPR